MHLAQSLETLVPHRALDAEISIVPRLLDHWDLSAELWSLNRAFDGLPKSLKA